ncbi:GatB/YqeY domain-containing protein [Flavobacteriaceae bacterium]|nr:GatB/YqeY domain-containing protein [Flavobacteriaceae bacterium]
MGVLSNLTEEMKSAMRAKDSLKLESLRAIKTAVLLTQTAGSGRGELSDDDAIKLLQRLVKQRKESAAIFNQQNRADLAESEEAQAEVIMTFLPKQLSEEAIKIVIDEIISKTAAVSMKDMGKVMGMASIQLLGKADGKMIASFVKQKLST